MNSTNKLLKPEFEKDAKAVCDSILTRSSVISARNTCLQSNKNEFYSNIYKKQEKIPFQNTDEKIDSVNMFSDSKEISDSQLKYKTIKEKKIHSLNEMSLKLKCIINNEEEALNQKYNTKIDHPVSLQQKANFSIEKNKKFSQDASAINNLTLEELIHKLTKLLGNTEVKAACIERQLGMKFNKTTAKYKSKCNSISILKVDNPTENFKNLDFKQQIENSLETSSFSKQTLAMPVVWPDFQKLYSLKEIHAAVIIQSYFRGYKIRKITSSFLRSQLKKKKKKKKKKIYRTCMLPLLEPTIALPHSSIGNIFDSVNNPKYIQPYNLRESGNNDFVDNYQNKIVRNSNILNMDHVHQNCSSHICKDSNTTISYIQDILNENQNIPKVENVLTNEIDLKKFSSNKFSKSSIIQSGNLNSSRNPASFSIYNGLVKNPKCFRIGSYQNSLHLFSNNDSNESQYSQLCNISSPVIELNTDCKDNSNSYGKSNILFNCIEKEDIKEILIPNICQMSPSYLSSKVKSELIFQETVSSALNHLHALQDFQPVSKTKKLHIHNEINHLDNEFLNKGINKIYRASNYITKRQKPDRTSSLSSFHTDFEHLEEKVYLRISKLEQEMRNKVELIVDSAANDANMKSGVNTAAINVIGGNEVEDLKEQSYNDYTTNSLTNSHIILEGSPDKNFGGNILQKGMIFDEDKSFISNTSATDIDNLYMTEDLNEGNLPDINKLNFNQSTNSSSKIMQQDVLFTECCSCKMSVNKENNENLYEIANKLPDNSDSNKVVPNIFNSVQEVNSSASQMINTTIENEYISNNSSMSSVKANVMFPELKALYLKSSSNTKSCLIQDLNSLPYYNPHQVNHSDHSFPQNCSKIVLQSCLQDIDSVGNTTLHTEQYESENYCLKQKEDISLTHADSGEPGSLISDNSDLLIKSNIQESIIQHEIHSYHKSSISEASKKYGISSIETLTNFPKNMGESALHSILNLLLSFQKEEEIRFHHQRTLLKLQEQFLIEEARLKLLSLNAEGDVNVRKRQRAIFLQLREQRTHIHRLMDNQNMAAQQSQLLFSQHYNLLSSASDSRNPIINKGLVSHSQSSFDYKTMELSSSESFENQSSNFSDSNDSGKLGLVTLFKEETNDTKMNLNKTTHNDFIKEEKNILLNHVFSTKREIFRKKDKCKKPKENSKSISVINNGSTGISLENSSANSKKSYSSTDDEPCLIEIGRKCMFKPILHSHENNSKNSSILNEKAKSDTEIYCKRIQVCNKYADDEIKKKSTGLPFVLKFPLSPRSKSLCNRHHSSESDDSFNLSHNETTSDMSDGEGKLIALREELAFRKAEAEKLKKEKRKILRERISTQEQALRKQIAVYDRYICHKKLEIEKESLKLKNIVTVKPLIKKPQAMGFRIPQHVDYTVTEESLINDSTMSSDHSLLTDNSFKFNTDILNATSSINKYITYENDSSNKFDCLVANTDRSNDQIENYKIYTYSPNNKLVLPIEKPATLVNDTYNESTSTYCVENIHSNQNISNFYTEAIEANLKDHHYKTELSSENINKYCVENRLDLTSDISPGLRESEITDIGQRDTGKVTLLLKENTNARVNIQKKANVLINYIMTALINDSVICIKNLLINQIKFHNIVLNFDKYTGKYLEWYERNRSLEQCRVLSSFLACEEKEIFFNICKEELKSTSGNEIYPKNGVYTILKVVEPGKEDRNKEKSTTELVNIQNTALEFYNDTDINETFAVSSCEGEWLEGEFWKVKEKIESQKELRNEEELLNVEIARLEELQKFKERYPNLVIREVPDKPPPPYTPPKGETISAAGDASLKYPEPQTSSNTISVPHRLSKADLRKIASDIVNIVPSREKIIATAESNLKILYTEWQRGKNPAHMEYPFHLLHRYNTPVEERDASEASESAFQVLIFDLTRQFVLEVCNSKISIPSPFWSPCLHHPKLRVKSTGDYTEENLTRHVVRNIQVLFGMSDAIKRESLLIKWAMKKKELVDQILVQELQSEEHSWIQYYDEEVHIKSQLSQEIFSSLIDETVNEFDNILIRVFS